MGTPAAEGARLIFRRACLVLGAALWGALPVSCECTEFGNRRPYGVLESGLSEVSGIAASRRHPDLFWGHNDSGHGPIVYAFIARFGKVRPISRRIVDGLRRWDAEDWEDISVGPGPNGGEWIYVADVGDNRFRRDRAAGACLRIVRFPEPDESEGPGAKPVRGSTRRGWTQVLVFSYPDGGEYDAECFAVHPSNGIAYLLTKRAPHDKPANHLYVFALNDPGWTPAAEMNWRHPRKIVPEQLPDPDLPGNASTGMDISPDGTRVVVRNLEKGYVYALRPEQDFSQVWSNLPRTFQAAEKQGEAVAFASDGRSLWTASEGSRVLYEMDCEEGPPKEVRAGS
jgi:hypothetical protein